MAKKSNLEQDQNEQFSAAEAFVNKNRKYVIGAIVAVVVLGLGWYLYHQYVSVPRENKASTELAKGQEYFMAEQFDKALNGDGATFAGFKRIADDYSSTDAGNLANLYAGLCEANLGKWQEAVNYLESFDTSSDAIISPNAVDALGNAYAHINHLDKAVECFKKAASMADKASKDGVNNTLSPHYLLQAGEVLESQGKKADALEIYQKIKKDYLNSYTVQTKQIDAYIERASR